MNACAHVLAWYRYRQLKGKPLYDDYYANFLVIVGYRDLLGMN